MQNIIWLVQHHADIVAWVLAVITATSVLVHGFHGLVLTLGFAAKWTVTTVDDEWVVRLDRWLTKAESGLAWLQAWIPTLGVNRAKAALIETKRAEVRRGSVPPSNTVDMSAVELVEEPDPAGVPTVPGRGARATKAPPLK